MSVRRSITFDCPLALVLIIIIIVVFFTNNPALQTQVVEYTMNGVRSLVEYCIKTIQSQNPPLQVDWQYVPRELVVRIFPYSNLEQ